MVQSCSLKPNFNVFKFEVQNSKTRLMPIFPKRHKEKQSNRRHAGTVPHRTACARYTCCACVFTWWVVCNENVAYALHFLPFASPCFFPSPSTSESSYTKQQKLRGGGGLRRGWSSMGPHIILLPPTAYRFALVTSRETAWAGQWRYIGVFLWCCM